MKKTSLVIALFSTLCMGSAMAEFKDFTVNGHLITKAQQEAVAMSVLNNNPHQALQDDSLETQVKDMLIEQIVVNDYAKKNGLDKLPEVQAQIKNTEQYFETEKYLATQAIISSAVAKDYLTKNPITDADIQKEYDAQKAKWGNEEVRIRVILVETEDEAKKIISDLKNNAANFAKVAAAKSLHEETKANGGIMEWNSPSQLIAPFSTAIAGLKKGDLVQTPVQTPAGYCVLKLEDVRPAQDFPKFEEHKQTIHHQLMQRKLNTFFHEQVIMADVKDEAKAK